MWLISPIGISTPIVFKYLATSSHISGVALNKSASGRVHLIGADNSIDKLEMFKVFRDGTFKVGNFLTSELVSYYPKYDGKVLNESALLS